MALGLGSRMDQTRIRFRRGIGLNPDSLTGHAREEARH